MAILLFTELWPSFGATDNVQYITAGDFDNDSDLDIVTSGGIGGESYVSILYNNSILTSIYEETGTQIPRVFDLQQNYPNPFNPSTTIQYSIKENTLVSLKIYDILGREITTLINEVKTAGIYKVNFDASNLSSGVYFYKLTAGNFIETKKMILLR